MSNPLIDISVFSGVQHDLRVRKCGVTSPAHGKAATELLDYGDATTLRSLYLQFLNDLCFANSPAACNPELEALCARLSAISGAPTSAISMAAAFSDLCYRWHPLHIKVQIAHFTVLMIWVDDLSESLKGEARQTYLEDLNLFHIKLIDPQSYSKFNPGRGDLHLSLEELIVFLKSDRNPFFATDNRLQGQLVKSILDFVEANLLEQHYEHHPVEFSGVGEMRLLPGFLRRKSGIAEPFAHFVIMNTSATNQSRTEDEDRFFYTKLYPSFPELASVIEGVNDVLSFYKEVRDGASGTCILNDARIHGMSPMDACTAYAQYVVNARKRVLTLVEKAESVEMNKRVLQFFQGYLSWHLGNIRYGLHEVLPDGWYNGECFG